jgi:hypothetical protein
MQAIERLLLTTSTMMAFTQAVGAPVVQQVGGALNHGGTITISGSGFGTKAVAAPLVWDNASGSDISDKWDGAWPSSIPPYNAEYHSPMRNIDLPHNHDTRYIAGDHYAPAVATAVPGGATGGGNVVVFKNIDLPRPFSIYASWYQRLDDAWTFGAINNIKTFAYSVCCSPYQLPHDWYTAYGPPHPTSSRDPDSQWVLTDDGRSLISPDLNGHSPWWGPAVNPAAGKWSKVEVAVKVTNQDDGYVQVYENGKQVVDYAGPTDKYPGTARTIGIGGWSRIKAPNNWRYLADIYLDTSLSRIVLANNAVLSQATIVENQIPSSWSDTAIMATVNLGQFQAGQPAYLFVVDSSGNPSASGLPVAVGGAIVGGGSGGGGSADPSAPRLTVK